jgi:hypothetical protein
VHGLSCAGTSLCVAVGDGRLATSIDPTSLRPSWRTSEVDGINPLYAVACPTRKTCVAGSILSWNPESWTGGVGRDQFTQISHSPLTDVWCSTAGLCFATDSTNIYATTTPTGPTWQTVVPGRDLHGHRMSVPHSLPGCRQRWRRHPWQPATDSSPDRDASACHSDPPRPFQDQTESDAGPQRANGRTPPDQPVRRSAQTPARRDLIAHLQSGRDRQN